MHHLPACDSALERIQAREALAEAEERCAQEAARAEAAAAAGDERALELTRRAQSDAHVSIAHEALQQEVTDGIHAPRARARERET